MPAPSADPLPSSFTAFADGLTEASALRRQITAAYRRSETEALTPLLEQARLAAGQAEASSRAARPMVRPAILRACLVSTAIEFLLRWQWRHL